MLKAAGIEACGECSRSSLASDTVLKNDKGSRRYAGVLHDACRIDLKAL
jgi:hypothetical protein